jgi:hypothetical protein
LRTWASRPGNLTVTNWVRDKGMGKLVGYIPAVVGGHKVELAATGKVFEPTPGNVRNFREWWKYIRWDQGWVFTLGCFLGMGLPALLTVQFIAPGTQIGGWPWRSARRRASRMRLAASATRRR